LTADHRVVPSAANKRTRRIQVRVTPAVYEMISRVAAADRREVAVWVAMVAEEAAARADRKLRRRPPRELRSSDDD
jgi:uncharacterized protein (DUF1778 family)